MNPGSERTAARNVGAGTENHRFRSERTGLGNESFLTIDVDVSAPETLSAQFGDN